MRKNIQNVITAWFRGRSHSERTCSTDGVTLYSYAMPIAKRIGTDEIQVVQDSAGPSSTTTSQIRAVAYMVGTSGAACMRVPRIVEG